MDNKDRFGFLVTVLYIIVEYGRPQEKIHAIGLLRPGLMAIALILISWIRIGKIPIEKNRQTTCMILLFLILALHIPFARNGFWAYTQAKGFLMYFPFLLSAIYFINTFDRLRLFINIWIGLMCYISFNIIVHGAGEGSGGSFLSDENDYSLLLNMMVPFSFFMLFVEKNLIKKLFYLFGCCLATMSIIVSASRGGFVGLLSIGFVMWFFSPKKIVTLLVLCVAALLIYNFAGDAYFQEMATVTDTEESTSSARIESWKSGVNMFLSHPLGVGGRNFMVWFPDHQTAHFKRVMWGREAHSLWIQLLTETGIFGVMIYGFLIKCNLKDIFRLKKYKYSEDKDMIYTYYLSLAFLASLAGYFSSGCFVSVLYYPHFFYVTAMIVATTRLAENKVSSTLK